jgi:hypothetical protein
VSGINLKLTANERMLIKSIWRDYTVEGPTEEEFIWF